MSDRDRLTQRSIHFFNAWFVRLDQTGRTPLLTNRLWILAVSLILLILLVINLLLPLYPDLPWPETLYGLPVLSGTAAILLLLLLVWLIWRNLLDPLLRLSHWAEMMRAVQLDTKIQLRHDSDFAELASDINMLGNMIKQLSRDTEVQLERHTDHISRESRSLAILYDVASSINFSRDLNELFEKTLAYLCTNLDARAGIIRQLYQGKAHEIAATQGNFNHTFLSSADHFLPVQYPLTGTTAADQTVLVRKLPGSTVFGASESDVPPGLTVLSVLVSYRQEPLGVIHLFFPETQALDLESNRNLLISIGQNLGSAVEKFRLMEEESELMVMQERTRLSHELHDSLAQTIASLRIQVRVIDETIQAHDKANMQQPMERIEYTIDQANHQLRALIAHFRVPINARGLAPAIEETIRQTRATMDIPIYLQNEWRQLNFEPDIELNVLRIVQECMANIRKHSQASSVRVYLGERNAAYVVLIEDDGVGFIETNTMPEGGRHLGLGILRDRAQQIDAKLDIESEPGEGTRVHLEFNQAPLPTRQ